MNVPLRQSSLTAFLLGAVLALPAVAQIPAPTTVLPAPLTALEAGGRPGILEVALDEGAYEGLVAAHRAGGLLLLRDFPLPADRTVDLLLRPVSIVPAGARALVRTAAGQEHIAPRVVCFSGHVPGTASTVFLGIAPEMVNGYLSIDGVTFSLSSGPPTGSRRTFVTDLRALEPGEDSGRDHDDWCRVVHGLEEEGPTAPTQSLGGTPSGLHVGVIDVFVELDHQFRGLLGSDQAAIDYGVLLYTAASEIYRRDLGLVFRIPDGYLRVWSVVPPWGILSGDDVEDLIADTLAFIDWWTSAANPLAAIPRTLVQVWTAPSVGGAATIGWYCPDDEGFALNSSFGSFPYPLQHTHRDNWDFILVCHETGHNCGSGHAFDPEAYDPPIECGDGTGPDNGTIMGYCFNLPGGAANVGLRFHPRVQERIRGIVGPLTCQEIVPVRLGDYDLDGVVGPADLAVFDTCTTQGFDSAGCLETFDVDGDGALTFFDRQALECLAGSCSSAVPFCTPAVPNSTGFPSTISWTGTVSVTLDNLNLYAVDVPPGNSGLFAYSPDETVMPLGNGILCLGNSTLGFVLRLPPGAANTAGTIGHGVDLGDPPAPEGLITPGSTWSFQCWYRDPAAGGAGFNFSDALRITFFP